MKIFKKIAFYLVLTIVLLAAGAMVSVHIYLGSAATQERIRAFASERLGGEVRFDRLDLNLLTGIQLRRFELSPQPPPDRPTSGGNFITIDRVGLGYRPWGLLRNRIELSDITLINPSLVFRQSPDGSWETPTFQGLDNIDASALSFDSGLLRFDFFLENFLLDEGSVQVLNEQGDTTFRADSVNVRGRLGLKSRSLEADGAIGVGLLRFGPYLTLTEVESPLAYERDELRLAGLTAACHGGRTTGQGRLELGPSGPAFSLQLDVRDIDLPTLVRDLQGRSGLIDGKLGARFQISGDLRQPARATGTGDMTISGARLAGLGILNILGDILEQPDLSQTFFDSITGTYKFGDERLTFYSVEAKSAPLQLSATGAIHFDRRLDMDVLLVLSPGLAERLPEAVRASFTTRSDGLSSITFKLTGTLENPTTNLQEKITPRATGENGSTIVLLRDP